jgi:hypothetical protein
MCIVFIDDEEGYLQWVRNHPRGFVVNTDKAEAVPAYPMVHRTTHKLLSSLDHYTDRAYFKVCSDNLQDLEQWSRQHRNKTLTYCQVCMR